MVPIFSKDLGNGSGQLAELGCVWPSGVAVRAQYPLVGVGAARSKYVSTTV